MQEARKHLPNVVRNKITQIDMGQEKSGLTNRYITFPPNNLYGSGIQVAKTLSRWSRLMMTVHTRKIKDESSDPILTINITIIRKILDMKV